MTQRTHSELFPTIGGGNYFNLFDQMLSQDLQHLIAPVRSAGAQLITEVDTNRLAPPYTILGYGFTLSGMLYNIIETLTNVIPGFQPGTYQAPIFATLGKLYGGIMREAGLGVGQANRFVSLPTDRTMISLLWDGQVDQPFPQPIQTSPTVVPAAASAQAYQTSLAQPVEVAEGDKVTIGLWLTPMVGQNVGVWIKDAACSIIYDK